MPVRALTLLNIQGDVTIVWDESSDDRMTDIIKKKMAEGITFFIIEPRMGGLVAPDRKELKRPAQAMKHRALVVRDADLDAFVGEGKATVVKTPDKPVSKTRVSRNPAEIAKNESIGVMPRAGG